MVLPEKSYQSLIRPVEDALGLPNAAYTSEEFLKQESELVFAKGWIGIAFDDDVASPGDLFPVNAAGQPLVIIRDKHRHIRVFHNVCRHRGTRLVDSPCSNKKQIVCPYHAWSYGLDGQLNVAPGFLGPEAKERQPFEKGTQDLIEVRSAIWNHVVMINLSGDAIPIAEWTENLDQRWSDYNLNNTFAANEITYDINCNWKLALENFLESYHLPVVHPTLNSYSPVDDHLVLVENRIMGQISLNYLPDDSGKGLPCFPDLPEDRQNRAEYLLLFPNLMLSVTPDHFRVTLTTPTSAESIHQRWRFFFVGEESKGVEFVEARAGVANRVDFYTREDISILERLQAGRHSPAYDGGRFSPYHETTTHHFQKMVAQSLMTRS